MRRKLGVVVGLFALTFFLSSCFMIQSFAILDYTLTPGQATKARFVLRPSNFDQGIGLTGPQYEFVVIGVASDSELAIQNGKWGTNGLFRGPLTMAVNGGLLTAMAPTCGSNGINFQDITNMTWKLFVTPVKIGDGNKFEKKAVVEVGIRAKVSATPGNEEHVIGVAGEWSDQNGNDTPDGPDFYLCEGIETGWVHVVAA